MLKALTLVSAIAVVAPIHAADRGGLTDKQIAQVIITIDEGEIEAAQIAKTQAQSEEVKRFADMMIQQHSANRAEVAKITRKDSIALGGSDLSDGVRKDITTNDQDLKHAPQLTFDKAYLAVQVDAHQKALAILRDSLLPSVQNPDLRAFLQRTQAAVNDHLDRAKNLQSRID